MISNKRKLQSRPERRIARFLFGLGAAAIVAIGAISASTAQSRLGSSLSGFSADSDEPIDIASDTLEVLDEQQVAIFQGNVKVVQGDSILKTKVLKVNYDGKINSAGKQQIRRLEALGKVLFESEDQTLTGDHAIFEMTENTVTVTGDVVLTQGQNVLRGSRLVIDLDTGRSRLEAPKDGEGGRVTGSFIPNSPRPGEAVAPPAAGGPQQ